MSFTLTPVFSDPLNGANQDPLNPTNWSVFGSGLGFTSLQVLNNTCQTQSGLIGGNYYSGSPALTSNQYCSIKVQSFLNNAAAGSSSDGFDLNVRGTADATTSYFLGVLANGDGSTVNISIVKGVSSSDTTLLTIASSPQPVAGDVYTLGAYGTTIFALKNGVSLGSVTDSSIASGFAAIDVFANAATTDYQFTNFVAGNVTQPGSVYSQPDCRDYSIFPNTAVPTNGTNIYTGQTSSNHAIPPTDSRAKVPVASGTYPQNSRTPGTYGPGE